MKRLFLAVPASLASALLVGSLIGACSSETGITPTAGGDGGRSDGAASDGGEAACGATSAQQCPVGETCATDADCATRNCAAGICKSTSATNGKKDGTETDVDCGGLAPACGNGKACAKDVDCKSVNCTQGLCTAGTATNGKKDGTETDIDCGGDGAPACAVGKTCVIAGDCASRDCLNGTCVTATSSDGRKNGTETDIDCGGASGKACAAGKGCLVGGDCATGSCSGGACISATANDQVKNGDETDVDCGGTSGKTCADGKVCKADGDCTSVVCKAGLCAAPTAIDGKKNGTETDIDCGGQSGKTCIAGKACVVHGDCASNGCRAGTCAIRESCRQLHGGGTCGAGEFGQPGANHEDCCVSVDIPRPVANGGAYKLDKYLVTAGRARAFLESVNYDVRGYIAAHKPAWWKDTWNPSVPSNYAEAMTHLGAGSYPATAWGGSASAGCYAGAGGGSTFWQSPQDQANYSGDVPRSYSQEALDEKALNCATEAFFAAFCAWDGGRPMKLSEWQYAIRKDVVLADATKPKNFFPWNQNNAVADAEAVKIWNFANYPSAGTQFGAAGWVGNYENPPAQIPPGKTLRDMAAFVAAPGRFPQGGGQFGNQDLIGVLESAGFDNSGNPGFWFQYSWQERGYQMFTSLTKNRLETVVGGFNHKHIAIGARCAR
jgi:hypothetical protein